MGEVHVGTLHIPEATRSDSQIQRWERKQPWRLTAHRVRMGQWVQSVSLSENIPKAAGPRRLHIVRAVRSIAHKLPAHLFEAGAKPLKDACINHGLAIDDDELVVTYEQVQCAEGTTWTEVEVYDITEDDDG